MLTRRPKSRCVKRISYGLNPPNSCFSHNVFRVDSHFFYTRFIWCIGMRVRIVSIVKLWICVGIWFVNLQKSMTRLCLWMFMWQKLVFTKIWMTSQRQKWVYWTSFILVFSNCLQNGSDFDLCWSSDSSWNWHVIRDYIRFRWRFWMIRRVINMISKWHIHSSLNALIRIVRWKILVGKMLWSIWC